MIGLKLGKPIGTYLESWDRFVGCKAQFKGDVVIINQVRRVNGVKYVDVIDPDTNELWKSVHTMSLIPIEYQYDISQEYCNDI